MTNGGKILRTIIIIVVIVIIIIFILAEWDRKRPRKVIPSARMYYGSKMWITAPMNLFVNQHVRRENDKIPFPNMEDNFPEHCLLQDNWEKIRDEVLGLYNQGEMTKIKGDLFFKKIADDNWKKFYIKWYSKCLPEAYQKLPFTTSLLDRIPRVQSAMISVLEPGVIITPHVGPFRGALRYHLGLQTPQDNKCRILIDSIPYSWRDGEDILFDDTFIHEVKNDTDKTRIILFCDVKRELDEAISNRVLNWACRAARVTKRKNKPPDKK